MVHLKQPGPHYSDLVNQIWKSATNPPLPTPARFLLEAALSGIICGKPIYISYVKDTSDFLRKIKEFIWKENYVLIALDVTSLYTSIEHSVGIAAIQYYLERRPPQYKQHNAMLVEMVHFCLHNNIFMFNSQLYEQIRGVAMGASFSPSYSCLHMGRWEELVLMVQHGMIMNSSVKMWLHYIDDLFVVWQGTI